jgi:myo-inositol-1(or 4)-monophosphatase
VEPDLSPDCRRVLAAVERCVGWLLTTSRVTVTDTKADVTDVVTNVDREMEERLLVELARIRPRAHVVAEESHGGSAPDWSAETWLVDPIDGTTNFLHGRDTYTVNVALWDDGDLQIGAVARPSTGALAVAERGRGAWMGRRRMRTSDTSELERALLTTGLDPDVLTDGDRRERFEALVTRAQGVRRTGAAGIDLMGVAEGSFDGYFEEHSCSWDWAAGCLLVEEAGGRVSDLDGRRWRPEATSIVASNRALHDLILAVLGSPLPAGEKEHR